ncbi:glycosyltransferase [Aliikangiella sp. G2MR2-5]|uniref:glycosyltransferase n=1 Tax=Aliikangiella sp. G2MR2-5 TaxID=2788943 RepID=UPI0018A9A0BE|nr:glycosyltransferase [Aliikangiella sp. G2MR2-5]
MKSVLHVIESLEFGGAEKVLLQLANDMSSDYHQFICMTKRAGELVKEAKKDISLICLEGKEGNDPEIVGKLAKLIIEQGINIVHIHNWSVYLEATRAIKLARKQGAKIDSVIHTVHGPYIDYSRSLLSSFKKSVRHFLERQLSRQVDWHVTVSDSIKEYIFSDIRLEPKKVVRIHNGIHGLESSPTEHPNGLVNVVAVGRLASIKNYPLLITAFSKIPSLEKAHLTLVGEGPEREALESLTESLGISKKVTFYGFSDKVGEILNSMDIFAVSSDYEGISIAILEAMSLGLPVIATKVGGIPETVDNGMTGLVVEPDVELYSLALESLVADNRLREEMGRRGFDYFRSHFYQLNVVKQYQKLYEGKQLENVG